MVCCDSFVVRRPSWPSREPPRKQPARTPRMGARKNWNRRIASSQSVSVGCSLLATGRDLPVLFPAVARKAIDRGHFQGSSAMSRNWLSPQNSAVFGGAQGAQETTSIVGEN